MKKYYCRNTLLFIVTLFILISSKIYPQFYSELSGIIEDRKRCAVSIEMIASKDDISKVLPTKLGSGFLAFKLGKVYVITNFHIVKQIRPDFQLLVGLNLKQGKILRKASVVSINANQDLAVLIMSDIQFNVGSNTSVDTNRIQINQVAVGISQFADSIDFIEGSGALLIGFPLGLGTDITGNEPISRIGIIAQSLRTTGHFLLDGIASHGNSGSPIFNIQSGKLLGIVVGFPSDYISAYDENGQMIARLPYNSGLSICISSSEIWKMIP